MWKTKEEAIEHIKKHPESHRHDFIGLQACSMVNGALDYSVMDAHAEYAPVGKNGGVICDTASGPCRCGAWH